MIFMIEERVLYKKLKEEKLFTRFCQTVSQAFVNNQFKNPRSKYDDYKIDICGLCSYEKDLNEFIRAVKDWEVDMNKIKIL